MGPDQRVIQQPMSALAMLLRHVFTNRTTQRRLSNENYLHQTFLLIVQTNNPRFTILQ
jgi:hypothetical protein